MSARSRSYWTFVAPDHDYSDKLDEDAVQASLQAPVRREPSPDMRANVAAVRIDITRGGGR
jgi:hypothetical protein